MAGLMPSRLLWLYGLGLAVLIAAAGFYLKWRGEQPNHPLTAGDGPEVVAMDFTAPFSLDPLPPGWLHRTFWTRPAMSYGLAVKTGIPAFRCETDGGGSILGRWSDIDLARFPTLSWRWLVEDPISSKIDEASHEGDDHPIRFFLQFADSDGGRHFAEIIWGNRLYARGDWKIIDGFVHYVADGGNENIGRWRDETADLAAIYRKASGRADSGRLTHIAIMCDSDDTGGHTVAYVGGKVVLKQ